MSENIPIQKGIVLLQQHRYKEAAEIFKSALAQRPEDAYALHLFAACQYHLPHQLKSALQTVDLAVRLEPDYGYHYELKAIILSELGKHKEALSVVEQALSLDPRSAYAHANKAYVYLNMQKWSDAEKAAREALACDADDLYAGNLLATALRMQNKLDENQELVSDMLAKDPDNAYAHANMGWVYFHRKNFSQAQVHFREALRLDPHFEPARIGMLETFKSKSWFYRRYISYCLFMSRQTKSAQIAIILGLFFGAKAIRALAKYSHVAAVQIPAVAVSFLYVLFVFWSWLARPLGGLIVLKDRFARYALKSGEKWDALVVGGGFMLGFVLLLTQAVVPFKPLVPFGAALVLAAIPSSLIFLNKNKWGRMLYAGMGSLIVALGLMSSAYMVTLKAFFHWPEQETVLDVYLGAGVLVVLAASLLGVFRVFYQEA